MTIRILEMGCSGCLRLEQNIRRALEELGVEAEVIKVTDVGEIIGYGVMRTPAVVINEKVKISGKVAEVNELKKVIKEVE